MAYVCLYTYIHTHTRTRTHVYYIYDIRIHMSFCTHDIYTHSRKWNSLVDITHYAYVRSRRARIRVRNSEMNSINRTRNPHTIAISDTKEEKKKKKKNNKSTVHLLIYTISQTNESLLCFSVYINTRIIKTTTIT